MKRWHRMFAILVAGLSLSAPAFASPILWTLSGVKFFDGGTAAGSFIYDASTNTYSSVSITTTAGSTRPGATYPFESPVFSSTPGVLFANSSTAANLTGETLLILIFSPSSLTNAGGTVPLSGAEEYTCAVAGCHSFLTNYRNTYSGNSLAGQVSTVPEPSSGMLLASSVFLGIRALLRRRTTAWRGRGVPEGRGASRRPRA
jgi:hypothetical protein